jgi:hypothetical protein
MQSDKNLPGISCGLVNDSNVFEWEVMLMISDDCKYYGGKTPPPSPPAPTSAVPPTNEPPQAPTSAPTSHSHNPTPSCHQP